MIYSLLQWNETAENESILEDTHYAHPQVNHTGVFSHLFGLIFSGLCGQLQKMNWLLFGTPNWFVAPLIVGLRRDLPQQTPSQKSSRVHSVPLKWDLTWDLRQDGTKLYSLSLGQVPWHCPWCVCVGMCYTWVDPSRRKLAFCVLSVNWRPTRGTNWKKSCSCCQI